MRAVRSTKLLSFVATAALAGMLGAGCGGGGTSNPCEGIQNACPTEGIHKCSGDTGIQTCEKNADGCLVWSAATQCGDLQTCQATGSDAACRCSNQCPQAGDTQCKSGTDVIQTCTANSYGCLAWVDGTDCATESKYCDDSSEPAVCAESCSDRCTQGETRCNGDVVEGCATAASGCLDWIPGANCADNGQICSDASGTAGCYAPCTDACDTVDATRCQGEAVQTCRVGNDGCKAWVVSEDCSTNNQYCVESGGSASCAATCQDRCPADGDTRCADDETVQTCTTVASGCLDWQKTDECSLPRTKCQVSGGTAQCVEQCQDVCDPNIDDSQCNGTMRQGCQVVAETGCYDWVDLEDCASNGGFCDNSVNPVVCADHCTNECDTLDAKRCISYLTIEEKGAIPIELRAKVSQWVFGCDICQEVCPWNQRFARPSADPAWQPRSFLDPPTLADFLALRAGSWRAPLRNSPLERPRRRGLVRNAAIAAGNLRDPKHVPQLTHLLTADPEPIVRAHAAWALGEIGHGQQALSSALEAEGDDRVREEIRLALARRS